MRYYSIYHTNFRDSQGYFFNLSVNKIIEETLKEFKVTREKLYEKTNKSEAVKARYCVMYLIRKNFNVTLFNIGKMFSRDHSTVVHGISKVNLWIECKWTEGDLVKRIADKLNLSS